MYLHTERLAVMGDFFHLDNKTAGSSEEYSLKVRLFQSCSEKNHHNLRDVRQFNIVTALLRKRARGRETENKPFSIFSVSESGTHLALQNAPHGLYVYIHVSVSFLAHRKSQIHCIT